MIFLDTGYFKGLLDSKDDHHEDSLNIKDFSMI
jgi:predicted nucleic acid-binding protein